MANSVGALSRRLCRSLLSTTHNPKPSHYASSMSMYTTESDHPEPTSDSDELDLDSVPPEQSSSPTQDSNPQQQQQQQRTVFDWPLENGLDVGIYKVHFFFYIDWFFLFIFLDFWFECINGVFDLNFCRRYWLGKWGRNHCRRHWRVGGQWRCSLWGLVGFETIVGHWITRIQGSTLIAARFSGIGFLSIQIA